MKRNTSRHTIRLRYIWGLIAVLLIGAIGLFVWSQEHRMQCAPYRDAIDWLATYRLATEHIALPDGSQTCLAKRNRLDPTPIFLAEEDGVDLLLALESNRPDLVLADQGMPWDSVMQHPWFQTHYVAVQQTLADQLAANQHIFAYHPGMENTGTLYHVGEGGTSEAVPALWGYRLSTPYVSREAEVTITLIWQAGSDRLAMNVPAPGYQIRVQMLAQDGTLIWSQQSQPLELTMQPVENQLRLTSPPMHLPNGDQADVGNLRLVAHLLHPDGRELPLYNEDALASIPYLPDSQFMPYSSVAQSDWLLSTDRMSPSIQLAGVDLPTTAFTGEKAKITLIWQALTTLSEDYVVFVHMTNSDGELIAQDDALPAGWRVPTSSWQTGMYVRDVHWLTIPPDTPRGEYFVYTGLYHVQTEERLWASSPDETSSQIDRIPLGSLWLR